MALAAVDEDPVDFAVSFAAHARTAQAGPVAAAGTVVTVAAAAVQSVKLVAGLYVCRGLGERVVLDTRGSRHLVPPCAGDVGTAPAAGKLHERDHEDRKKKVHHAHDRFARQYVEYDKV